jgi:hypothetical protein
VIDPAQFSTLVAAVQAPKDVNVLNWPTPGALEQTALAYQADGLNPVAASHGGTTEVNLLAAGDDGLANGPISTGINPAMVAFMADETDFGCPIDVDAMGIKAKICIKYQYAKSLTIVGYEFPFGLLCTFGLVCIVVIIIRNR